MRLRTALLAMLGLFFFGQIFTGLYDWHTRQELARHMGAPSAYAMTCGLGELPMSVDGSPVECMTGAQFDGRKLADQAITDGHGRELLAVLHDACGAGELGSCEEAIYLERRLSK